MFFLQVEIHSDGISGFLVFSAEADIMWKSLWDRSGKTNKLHAKGYKFPIS